jgi:hypothetical protein
MGLLTRSQLVLGEYTLGWFVIDDVLERRCEVGVVVPLELGDETSGEKVVKRMVAVGELEELESTTTWAGAKAMLLGFCK